MSLNPMRITAEDVARARAAQQLLPKCVALRLGFRYSVAGELSQKPLELYESVALLFDPKISESDIDARLVEALGGLGAAPQLGGMGARWRGIDIRDLSVAVMDPQMSGHDEALANLSGEDEAREICARIACEVGQRAAQTAGAVGWRRTQDYPHARSVVEGLGMAFEELGSLRDALEIRRAIGERIGESPSPARSLPRL